MLAQLLYTTPTLQEPTLAKLASSIIPKVSGLATNPLTTNLIKGLQPNADSKYNFYLTVRQNKQYYIFLLNLKSTIKITYPAH